MKVAEGARKTRLPTAPPRSSTKPGRPGQHCVWLRRYMNRHPRADQDRLLPAFKRSGIGCQKTSVAVVQVGTTVSDQGNRSSLAGVVRAMCCMRWAALRRPADYWAGARQERACRPPRSDQRDAQWTRQSRGRAAELMDKCIVLFKMSPAVGDDFGLPPHPPVRSSGCRSSGR